MGPCRATTRSSAARGISLRSSRWAIAVLSGWRCSLERVKSGRTRTGPTAATRSTSSSRAQTYGWPLVSLAASIIFRSLAVAIGDVLPRRLRAADRVLDACHCSVRDDVLHRRSPPKWKGDVFVGALREGEIPGTGDLERILFNEKMEELRRESLLQPLRQRIRDVRQGPDGLLYLLTDEDDGAVLRIEPAP